MKTGFGILNKRTGTIVLSRPGTDAAYWQADLETIQRNTQAAGRTDEYEIVPVRFSRRGVYSVQSHERVTVLKPEPDTHERDSWNIAVDDVFSPNKWS